MISRRIVIIAGLALLILCLVAIGVIQWQRAARAGAEARYSNESKKAGAQSAKDAIEATGAAHARETDIKTEVERLNDEISKAPAGDSNAAAERAACQLRSYRHSRRCVELLGAPAK